MLAEAVKGTGWTPWSAASARCSGSRTARTPATRTARERPPNFSSSRRRHGRRRGVGDRDERRRRRDAPSLQPRRRVRANPGRRTPRGWTQPSTTRSGGRAGRRPRAPSPDRALGGGRRRGRGHDRRGPRMGRRPAGARALRLVADALRGVVAGRGGAARGHPPPPALRSAPARGRGTTGGGPRRRHRRSSVRLLAARTDGPSAYLVRTVDGMDVCLVLVLPTGRSVAHARRRDLPADGLAIEYGARGYGLAVARLSSAGTVALGLRAF